MSQTNQEADVGSNRLRVDDWEEFVGQETVKKNLAVAISAAKKRKETLDHVLFYGPPGLGKTTLAGLIAKELGVGFRQTSGPALTRPGDLAAILSGLEEGEVLFIDEIHRLPKAVEETLYPALEDFALDVVLGKGPAARTLRIELPRFTLVAATTKIGRLSAPMRDRFGLTQRLSFYNVTELMEILKNAADKLGTRLDTQAAQEIASRARFTARVALKLLRRVRDLATVNKQAVIDGELAKKALAMLEIDNLGLEETDRKLLEAVVVRHGGGPVGLTTMAALINEESETIEDVMEPFLLRSGLLKRTQRGRMATNKAYKHLRISYPGEI